MHEFQNTATRELILEIGYFLATVRCTFNEIIFQTKDAFLQCGFDFNAFNHQSYH